MAPIPHYVVAGPSEYLAITGWKIPDIKLAKKALILPGQRYVRFAVSPVNYTFQVDATTVEEFHILIPAIFIIGPKVDDKASLVLYAKLLSLPDVNLNHVNDLVQGIVEDETRVVVASMTLEEVLKVDEDFQKKVFGRVQLELNQFGLFIYIFDVKKLADMQSLDYFLYSGLKTHMEAANRAKIDVPEARMNGKIGAAQRERLTTENAAKIDDAETLISKPMRKSLLDFVD